MADSLADFERDLDAAIAAADEAFNGKYRKELDALLGLSKNDIDAITPDTTDLQTYDKLMAVVREASRKNVSQAQLFDRIHALGDVAIAIARKAALPV